MRIRKKQPPLPLSALSPVPLPDPHSDNNSPVVQLHNNHHPHHNLSQLADIASHLHPQPSDWPNRPIGNGSNASSDSSDNPEKKNCSVLLRKEDQEEKSNDSRQKITLGGAEIVVSESRSSHQGVGRWCEGEKAFPLKKRRGNFERKSNEETTIVEKEDNNKMKTKTKINKKFGLEDDDDESGKNSISSAKKRGRGGALMQGSRCSRVNGRGWRCCQQTLVGYSLCEHHLGKGRLRSMSSVRSRALGTSAPPRPSNNNTESTHPPPLQKREEPKREDEGDDEEKPLMIISAATAKAKKKRMKVGMVKARSMSSLLGQTNNEITVSDKISVDDDDDDDDEE